MSNQFPTSRRDFLKTSTLAGAALAGGLSLARSAPCGRVGPDQGGPDRLRRTRQRGHRDCLDADPAIKVIAVADAFEDKAKGAAKTAAEEASSRPRRHLPDDRVFVGLDAYQKAIDCGPDMVVTATPARLPPDDLRRRDQGRQARLHGEALLRRRPRLPHR